VIISSSVRIVWPHRRDSGTGSVHFNCEDFTKDKDTAPRSYRFRPFRVFNQILSLVLLNMVFKADIFGEHLQMLSYTGSSRVRNLDMLALRHASIATLVVLEHSVRAWTMASYCQAAMSSPLMLCIVYPTVLHRISILAHISTTCGALPSFPVDL
jgi:hypothetical protein